MKIPPPRMNLTNVDTLASSLPEQPGCYFWYFRELKSLFQPKLFDLLELDRAIQHDEYTLLYVGIAEGQTIQQRIFEKHLGSAHVSTLRHSLGSLIAHQRGIPVDSNVTKGKFAISPSWKIESLISHFLTENAMISWTTTDTPKDTEDFLLKDSGVSLPLNIKSNPHPLNSTLSSLRKQYKRC